MKHLLLQTSLACALACMSLSASAVGRVADVNVIDRSTGQTLPVHFHRGEYWVAGQPGAKYSIQIRNSRGSRVLAVTSVDGLNVLSGDTADFGQSGYVFESGQRYGIEGWRKSDSEVAAFVFTASPGDSYAERIGKPRDMGVIGVALFRERPPVAVVPHPHIYSSPSGASRKEAPAPSSAPAPAPVPTAPISKSAPAAETMQNSQTDKSSSSMERERAASSMPAPKLGTAHGERETSVVSRTQFVRNSSQPDEIIRIRYDSHANLMAMGIIPSPRPRYPHAPDPFPGSPLDYAPDPPTWR